QSMLFDVLARVMTVEGAAAPAGVPAPAAVRPLITRHSIAEERQGLRVLLAEDNPVNQRVALVMLQKRGHLVTVAADGVEALHHLAGGEFDVVLMDVHMPRMGGFETTAEIRR